MPHQSCLLPPLLLGHLLSGGKLVHGGLYCGLQTHAARGERVPLKAKARRGGCRGAPASSRVGCDHWTTRSTHPQVLKHAAEGDLGVHQCPNGIRQALLGNDGGGVAAHAAIPCPKRLTRGVQEVENDTGTAAHGMGGGDGKAGRTQDARHGSMTCCRAAGSSWAVERCP